MIGVSLISGRSQIERRKLIDYFLIYVKILSKLEE